MRFANHWQIFFHISKGGRDENEMCWLDVDDGFTVIAAMRELGLRPSRIALEALLDACASMNDSEQAQRVVAEMEKEGLALNVFSQIRYPNTDGLTGSICVYKRTDACFFVVAS